MQRSVSGCSDNHSWKQMIVHSDRHDHVICICTSLHDARSRSLFAETWPVKAMQLAGCYCAGHPKPKHATGIALISLHHEQPPGMTPARQESKEEMRLLVCFTCFHKTNYCFQSFCTSHMHLSAHMSLDNVDR